jgi:hypothetical protein
MPIIYKKNKKKKSKYKKAKNALQDFADKMNNRSNAYQLDKIPFIQTR